MNKDIVELKEDISSSPLYSEDLAPVPESKRTWSVWSLAAIWVGMAVCIPTYMLASSMIIGGLGWVEAIIIIGLANVIITIPMILSGHAGVKYGIPFPVLGRSSFGYNGIHFPAIVRGLIAAVWFGIQTWIGGFSIYSIYCVVSGTPLTMDLDVAKFVCFFIFWLINVYFIWKGTESIKLLELFAAPILVLMGVALIIWGSTAAGGFEKVLDQVDQLKAPSVVMDSEHLTLGIHPIEKVDGTIKAEQMQITLIDGESANTSGWIPVTDTYDLKQLGANNNSEGLQVKVQMAAESSSGRVLSKELIIMQSPKTPARSIWWSYAIMLTAMVGFWSTMAISIADITRYSKTQKDQIMGQFIGLPGTMILYSFVGIFVTAASLVLFDDILLRADAPWDPAALLSKFDGVTIIIVSQIFLLVATLSTNIAANVIAPANAFSNAFPKRISFRSGGLITAVFGILICPWWIINHIIPLLLFISSLLGPVVAILICDYFIIRKTNLNLPALYQKDGEYAFGGNGVNNKAIIAFVIGAIFAGIGNFVPALSFLYDISWFSGFIVSFVVYYLLMKNYQPGEQVNKPTLSEVQEKNI
ncbi:MAG: NCS1 family nucleobase:cation symporter-1 [Crocinitomicaceae bacterium]|nr:NCS1 family nucleobase:cation symporter-1 [Crocinitomicaceae bacterium]